ncbi:hypothetical protein AFL01nite_01280 [Aeromicrobium flavum]|uniref:DUF2567 domain-containing protein n=1 Tax=Aeromicrobium flavum TaxID=416568 RepID=A0A512HQS1_9ACTN|nr:hypothetical protein [Aeromicrobium flavum]GEO87801.1 hypothetical protein AFL01nite_01280 [Aeromicrobium flavum]
MTRTAWAFLATAASGVPAAFVWWAFARPSQWLATESGLVLTEGNAQGRFQVVAVFTLVGLALGLVAGALVQRATRPSRWSTVVGLVAATVAASLVCWRLGVWLGPPAPQEATGLEVGDTVPAMLAVDAVVPFLVWPLTAVLGYTLALYLGSDGVDERDEADAASTDELSERSGR